MQCFLFESLRRVTEQRIGLRAEKINKLTISRRHNELLLDLSLS
jgi:hypothetical protein